MSAELKDGTYREEALKTLQKPLVKHKLVLLGDMNVGKSSIFQRFITGEFPDSHEPTIGSCYNFKNVEFEEHIVRVELWDTAGQERFRSLIPSYIKDSSFAVIAYDISNRVSFTNVQTWVSDARNYRGNDVSIILVGNKIDLADKRKVSTEEGESLAKELDIMFIEVSAKAAINVKSLFKKLAGALPGMEQSTSTHKGEGDVVKLNDQHKQGQEGKEGKQNEQERTGKKAPCC